MGRYADLVSVLAEDEAVLYRAWIAHTTVHQQPTKCGDDCEDRRILGDALARMRDLLAAES